jgi:hypothetical protein
MNSRDTYIERQDAVRKCQKASELNIKVYMVKLAEFLPEMSYVIYKGKHLSPHFFGIHQINTSKVPNDLLETIYRFKVLESNGHDFLRKWNLVSNTHQQFLCGVPGQNHELLNETNKLRWEELTKEYEGFAYLEGCIFAQKLLKGES